MYIKLNNFNYEELLGTIIRLEHLEDLPIEDINKALSSIFDSAFTKINERCQVFNDISSAHPEKRLKAYIRSEMFKEWTSSADLDEVENHLDTVLDAILEFAREPVNNEDKHTQLFEILSELFPVVEDEDGVTINADLEGLSFLLDELSEDMGVGSETFSVSEHAIEAGIRGQLAAYDKILKVMVVDVPGTTVSYGNHLIVLPLLLVSIEE